MYFIHCKHASKHLEKYIVLKLQDNLPSGSGIQDFWTVLGFNKPPEK